MLKLSGRVCGEPEHVDKIQAGHNDRRLKGAFSHHGLDGATPVAEALAGARQADAPLIAGRMGPIFIG